MTTTETLRKMKADGRKISMLTAYDFATASLLDEAGIDILLVGDSLGMVVLGYDTTLPVTMEDMLHHTRAVAAGAKNAMVVGDMPFMSYQSSTEKALENAGAFLKEAGARGVKVEGGVEIAEMVSRMTVAGIPVMGHLGLTPQSVHQFGGYGLQAKETGSAKKLIDDAMALEAAGAFAIVLEKIPAQLSEIVSMKLAIPTIGIGAGASCDGQVLVTNDMLGLYSPFTPKFAKKFCDLSPIVKKAVAGYITEVQEGAFPAEEHTFTMGEDALAGLKRELGLEAGD